jgi:hypothetical protein
MAFPIQSTTSSSPTSTLSPISSFSPPKTILPRSQPPRPTPISHSTPAVPTKASVAMATTASMPGSIAQSSSSLLSAYSQPPSTSSTASSSSSFRPAITPSTSNVFAAGSHPRSPPRYGKVRALTTSSGSSSASTTTGGLNGTGTGVGTGSSSALLALVPQTGASKMAAAAKRGATGLDGIPRPRRGSQAVAVEEEDHPLSDKSLRARCVSFRTDTLS